MKPTIQSVAVVCYCTVCFCSASQLAISEQDKGSAPLVQKVNPVIAIDEGQKNDSLDTAQKESLALQESMAKALRNAGFALSNTADTPVLSINAKYFKTGCQVRYVRSNELVNEIRRISGTVILMTKDKTILRSTITWPKSPCGYIRTADYFAGSVLVELAIHGIRRDGAIEAWLDGGLSRGIPDSIEADEAYKDFARIGDRAVPKLREVIARDNYPSNLNAARALGAIGTVSAFEVVKRHIRGKQHTNEGSEMCEGLRIASETLPSEVLEDLKRLYTVGLDPFCMQPIRHVLREHRMITTRQSSSLYEAAEVGDLDAVARIISSGTDVTARNNHGDTALHLASRNGHTEVVRALLAAGADVNAKGPNSLTPLSFASLRGHAEVVSSLLAADADLNARRRSDGGTAIHIAAEGGKVPVIKALLAVGAEVDAKANRDRTALFAASLYGQGVAVNFLLAAGADVNAKDVDGWTPLFAAARQGHTKIVNMLLGYGAVVDAKTHDGKTALMVASERGHSAVVAALTQTDARSQ